MRGLLVAYSFHPQNSVGALRPTYWAEECAGKPDFTLDVVTATEGKSSSFQRFHVPLKGKSIWSSLIRDEGLRWSKDLMQWFRSKDISQYDFVLFTGGPFFHFHTAKYLKKQGLKVYFDFRDPFSYNPRFNEKGIKKIVKQGYERHFLKQADAIISVNDACHDYIGPGMKLPRWVIPNGFDERNLPAERGPGSSSKLFYGGKFYWIPEPFFEAVKETETALYHAGNPPFFDHTFLHGDRYNALGLLDQKKLYQQLQTCEIGVVFTIDIPFESTTKIYDYMALGKKILVVTKGEPNVGVLKRELDNYPSYRWVKNDVVEITEAIQELKAMPENTFDADHFSRKHALDLLIQKIKANA
jgi:hypothetical protein